LRKDENMKRKAVSGIMLTLLVISMLTLAFNIQPVEASGTIYIKADGSVDPPYAPIQRSGNFYTFTGNIDDSITILRNNAVVDGAGYTVDIKTEGGISLGGSNITFKNTRITSSAYYTPAISVGSGNTVSDNTITYAAYGISLSSSGSTVSGNTITYAKYDGILLSGSHNTVSYNTITAGEKGIHLNGADYNDVFGNVIRNSDDGIFLRGSSDYNMFSGNEIVNNKLSGICLSGSSNNTITGNNITNSNYGIELYYTSNNNAIFGNVIRNNERGVDMSFYQGSPTNNAIYLNNITNNNYGVHLESSDYNKFYHNNFVGNTKQVYLYDSIDYWDDDYPSGGNYWSDYTGVDLKSGPNQDLSGSDGIGDTPYVIEGYIKDRYPLMNPWTPPPPDFSITASPTSLTILQGSSGTSAITITSIGSFNQLVQLTVSGAPSGVTTTLNPEKVTPPPDGSKTSTLTVSVGTTATLGSYTLTVTGTSGTLTHSVDVSLEITITVEPLEKTIEVMWAGMTVFYNRVDEGNGEDVYVVSKISAWSMGMVMGITEFSITRGDATLWRDRWILPGLRTKDYVFEGFEVRASDRMNVVTRGLTPGLPTGFSVPSPNVDTAWTTFRPDAPIETSTLFTPLINWIVGKLFSPGELRVYDSQGRVTGLVNGEVKEEIPNSGYFNNTIMILSPSGSYRYEVAGTEDGSYGLVVASAEDEEVTTFVATDIPISTNAIHQYTIDWVALSQGEEGVTVKVDSDGDGVFELTFTTDSELTQDEFILQVPSAEAFPMWIVGAAVAAIAIATVAIAVFWRRRKQHPTKG